MTSNLERYLKLIKQYESSNPELASAIMNFISKPNIEKKLAKDRRENLKRGYKSKIKAISYLPHSPCYICRKEGFRSIKGTGIFPMVSVCPQHDFSQLGKNKNKTKE